MASIYLILTVIVFLASHLAGVTGQIRCYSCNSYTDGVNGRACLNPMSPNISTIVCPRNYVCSRVTYVTQKIFVTSRSCDPATNTCRDINNSLKTMYPDLASFNCNTCSMDYCNGSSVVTFNVSVVMIGSILAKILLSNS